MENLVLIILFLQQPTGQLVSFWPFPMCAIALFSSVTPLVLFSLPSCTPGWPWTLSFLLYEHWDYRHTPPCPAFHLASSVSFFFLFLRQFVYLCVCTHRQTERMNEWTNTNGGQKTVSGDGSVFLPCGFWGLNSDPQAWRQVPWQDAPSLILWRCLLEKHFLVIIGILLFQWLH